MEPDIYNKVWKKASAFRTLQHACGSVSAIMFILAFLLLFDGLQARMRSGPEQLDLLPGEELVISGPCPVKNPVASDILSRWTPQEPLLAFHLEGFYAGYWFGSGMWRGSIRAAKDARQGLYVLALSFRGASAQSIQKFEISLYDSAESRQAGSRSLVMRAMGLNPFIYAAASGLAALFFALPTYLCGIKYNRTLISLGFAEIYRVDVDGKTFWCLCPRNRAPQPGAKCAIISTQGKKLAYARCEYWQKGRLKFYLVDGANITTNDLVCLSPS